MKWLLSCSVLLASFLLSGLCLGQSTPNTNAGKSFTFGFMGNNDGSIPTYAVHMTSFYPASGKIYINNVLYQTFTVVTGAETYIPISPNSLVLYDGEGIANMSIHVVTNANISLYYSEEYGGGPRDEYTYVLPDTILGNSYYVLCYASGYGSGSSGENISQFLITSPNKVRVQITPSANTANHSAGISYDTTIQSGQIYEVHGENGDDLTGTQIVAVNSIDPTQKFAVFAGQDVGRVGCSGTVDPLFEQIYPTNNWGKSYIFVSTEFSDDICRVLASQSGTTISFNGTPVSTLSAGQYYDDVITPATPTYISANHPIEVAKILQTSDCNNNIFGLGDPSIAIVQPDEDMFIDSSSFYSDQLASITNNYLEIVTRTADDGNINLDGTLIPSTKFQVLTSNPTYCYDTMQIGTGAHYIKSIGCGFFAYAGGMGSLCSTSSGVNVYLRNLADSTILSKIRTPSSNCSNNNGTASVNVQNGIPPYSYSWSNGQTAQKDTGLSAGVYTVTVSYDCIPNVITDTVIIGNNSSSLNVSITPKPDSICPGDSSQLIAKGALTYKWSTGITSDSIWVKPSTTTTYTLYSTAGPCSDTTNTTIHITLRPIVTTSGDTSICKGNNVTISASGGAAYMWLPGGSTNSSISVSPPNTTTYTVSVSNGKCAKDSTVTVNVNKAPDNVIITPPQKLCLGSQATLTANGACNYLWSNGATTSSITVSPGSTSTFSVEAGCHGCDTSLSSSITVGFSVLHVCCDTMITTGDTISLQSSGSTKYNWIPDIGLSCNNCPNPLVSPSATVTYTVSSIDTVDGCTGDTAITVTVYTPCADLYVPNVFTPNNDGINDLFVISPDTLHTKGEHIAWVDYTNYSIIIYDRWGKEVYSSTNPTEYWNGKIMNTLGLVPDGVYYYIIKATCGKSDYEKKGFVQVLGEK